jgi:tetratricopeptide (TPR) repeat protein
VWLIMGCAGNGAQMRQQLETLEQQNSNGEKLLNDSLAETLVVYFDKHGDANEQMRAKYILGCTYCGLNELPRALMTYYEAADCADTAQADCNYKLLSLIHGQCAMIYHTQVQPRSELQELRLSELYAWKDKDTLQAIKRYSQQSGAYDFLKMPDSVIYVKERAAQQFREIGRRDRAARTLGGSTITSLLKKGDISKALEYSRVYEQESGLFDADGNISKGFEIYYYIKGECYLAINQPDSAEYWFRKELHDGKDIRNQIAGSKGLQKVFGQKKISDSIAKYATLAYELNDSAYSLSEMENIQKFQASYNYNHHRFLAKQKESEAMIAWLTAVIVMLVVGILFWYFFRRYRLFKTAALDYRLKNAEITRRLRSLAKSTPPQYPTNDDWRQLRSLVEHEIPVFYDTLNVGDVPLTEMEYDICLLTRVHILPNEIAKLKKCVPSYVSNIRKNLLKKVFGREGNTDEFDDEISKIGNKTLKL